MADGPAPAGTTTGVAENRLIGSELVAHVRDLETGEIAVYHGAEEFTFHDREVAARLFRTSR